MRRRSRPESRISLPLRSRYAGALAVAVVLTGCSLGGGRVVQVLANVRDAAPGQAWSRETSVLHDDVLPHIGGGDRLVVAPIGTRSYTDPPVLDLTLASPSAFGANPLQLTLQNRRLLRSAYATAVRGLARDRSARQTEIVAALMAAADRFSAEPDAVKVLVLDSTAYEQSSIVNMADSRETLDAGAIAQLVAHIRVLHELPDLHGVRVCVTGITAGERGWADEERVLAVRAFWRAFFAASGATLVSYGTSPDACF